MFHAPEQYRIRKGILSSDHTDGNNGRFEKQFSNSSRVVCIVSDGHGWEHVSARIVMIQNNKEIQRTPTWAEMCKVKDMFWDADDWVIQYHPAESDYVNNSPHCLHLWRPVGITFPTPPSILVGVKNLVIK